MAKILFFLVIFFILLKGYLFGQACTPDPQYTNTSTQKGTHPDTIVNLGPAYAGSPYSQTITILVPPDTTVPFIGTIIWDSSALVSVSGLPPGFTYSCSNTSSNPYLCSWKSNSIGCVIITGTPSLSDIGTYPLQFLTNNYLGGSITPNPYTATGYKIIVNSSSGIHENPNIQLMQQNNPNPFEHQSDILFTSEENGTVQFKIYNLIGTAVQEYDIAVKKGINKLMINAKKLNSGIYFYSIIAGNNVFTRKMIVKK